MAKSPWKKINLTLLAILLLVVSLGLWLRIGNLSNYPVELHSQEALLGWRAKSLLLTGKDETGRSWPLIFSSFEGYQLPLASYLVIPFVKFLGLTPLAVRLPLALFGTLAIPALFGLVYLLFPKDWKIALWSAFFIAVNPWTVYLSRNSSLTNLSFSLFLLGFYFLLLGWKGRLSFYWLAILFLTLSLFAAKAAWFFVPFFLIFAWVFLFKRERRMMIKMIVISLLFFPLLLAYVKAPQVKLDFFHHDLSLLSEPSIQIGIESMRGENIRFGSPFLGKVFYNKLFYLQRGLSSFLGHFNPRFYFASGDGQPLHGLTNFGPILVAFMPLALAGIWLIWKKKKNFLLFLTGWFCLATVPSFLVFPSPDQSRLIFALPVLAIATAYCLSRMKKSYLMIFLLLLGFNFIFVLDDAYLKEPIRFQEERQVGYRQLAQYLEANWENYQKIYLTDAYGADPGPALLFYLNYPSEQFQKDQSRTLVYRNWIDRVDKIIIDQRSTWGLGEENLYLIAPDEEKLYEEKGQFLLIGTIENLKEEPVFLVFEYEEKINQ